MNDNQEKYYRCPECGFDEFYVHTSTKYHASTFDSKKTILLGNKMKLSVLEKVECKKCNFIDGASKFNLQNLM